MGELKPQYSLDIPMHSPPRHCKLILWLSQAAMLLLVMGLHCPLYAQAPAELQNVTWTSLTNVTFSNGVLGKNAGGDAWNAGAISNQHIIGDGRIEFTVTAASSLAVGLNFKNKDNSYHDLDHGILFTTAGNARANEGTNIGTTSTAVGTSVTYDANTVFIIKRTGSVVQYWKRVIDNNVVTDTLMHTSAVPSTGRVIVDCTLHSTTGQITSCKIHTGDLDEDGLPDVWEESYLPPNHGWNAVEDFDWDGHGDGDSISNLDEYLSGTSPVDELSRADVVDWPRDSNHQTNTDLSGSVGGLKKYAPGTSATYNTKAIASKAIMEDGIFVFQVAPGMITTVGLNTTESSTVYTDVEWTFITSTDGTFDIDPNGTPTAYNTSTYAYNESTVFAIQRENGQIRFLKDGVLMYTASAKSYGPLYPVVWLSSAEAEIKMARLYNGDVDGDLMSDKWELRYLPADADRADLDAFMPTPPAMPSYSGQGDDDADGLTNIQEFYDDTHPQVASGYPANIDWVRNPSSYLSLVTGSKDGVKKISGGAAWNADAVGTTTLQQSGRLAFTFNDATHLLAAGLTLADGSRSYTDLEYSIYANASGQAFVYEGVTQKLALGAYTSSTRFGIRRVGRQVMIFKDGIPWYVSSASLSPSAALLADSSFNTVDSEIKAASLYRDDVDGDLMPDAWEMEQWARTHSGQMPTFEELRDNFLPGDDPDGDQITNREEQSAGSDPYQELSKPRPVIWTNLTNTSTTGLAVGSLKKTYNSAAYNADATSSQFLVADGTLTFSAATTGTLIAGFALDDDATTNVNTDADLAYAFILTSGGSCSIQRPTAEGADFAVGTYTSSTIFAIRRNGTTIEYLKDGVVVYTSTTPSTGNLYVDCSILTYNHQLTTARLHYFDVSRDIDGDGVPDDWELMFLPLFATQSTLAALNDSSDNDGVSILDEYLHGTSPISADTDQDGMSDLWEITYGFAANNPLNAGSDADDDNLSNLNEFIAGTNPLDPDTDDDGIPDGYEVTNDLLPLDSTDALADKDGDRVPNLWEYARGRAANNASDPVVDAIVDPIGTNTHPTGHYEDIASAVSHLAASSSTRFVVRLGRGVHDTTNLDMSGVNPRMIAFVGELGNSTPNEGAIIRGGSWVLTGESVISGLIFEGGSGIRLAPPTPGAGEQASRVQVVNCLMRDVHPYRATGAADASYGGAVTNQGASLTLEHCTFHRCGSWKNGGLAGTSIANLSGTLKLKNCVLWDDLYISATPISGPNGSITVQASVAQGGLGGAINQNPQLTSKGYLTALSSMCFSAGATTTQLFDLHEQLRPATTPSLGAVQWLVGGLPAHLVDTDGDGLPDVQENILHTSNLLKDTDGDGIDDGQEIDQGTDPLDKFDSAYSEAGLKILTPLNAAP